MELKQKSYIQKSYIIKDGKKFYDKNTRKQMAKHFFLLDKDEILKGKDGYLSLSDNEILIHLKIATYYGPDKSCILKVSTISNEINLSIKEVFDCITALKKKDVLHVVEQKRKKSSVIVKELDKTYFIQEELSRHTTYKTGVKIMKNIEWFEKLSKPARRVWLILKAARNDEWLNFDEWLNKEYDESYINKKELRKVLDLSRTQYKRCIAELINAEAIESMDTYSKKHQNAAFKVF